MLTRRSLFGFLAAAPVAAAGVAVAEAPVSRNIVVSTGAAGLHQAGLQCMTVVTIGAGGGGGVIEGNISRNSSAGRFDG